MMRAKVVSSRRGRSSWRLVVLCAVAALLAACSGGSDPMMPERSATATVATPPVSPFIAVVQVAGDVATIASVEFTVMPKAQALSRPVHASYSRDYLARTGYGHGSGGAFTLPVFGLYAGFTNTVQIDVRYDDGSAARTTVSIPTPAFDDPTHVYDRLRIVKARAAGVVPGFDFLYIKSDIAGPVVLDTDGEVRWWVPGGFFARSSAFSGDGFIIGDDDTLTMTRVRLDGKVATSTLAGDYLWFHHNVEPGRQGLLFELDRSLGAVIDVEDIVTEIDADGKVLRQWDFGDILAAYMREHGDDPSGFIRNGIDWFHVNSAIYDPRDDSLIVSSRENFVIKIGYATNDIRWIFGDPTKGWYTLYPSLRAKAVLLDGGGLYPVGQHSLSLTPEGALLLFNNGRNSISPPIGGNAGENRTYTAMSAYTIDPAARTAKEVLRFDHGQAEFSQFCGSAYESGGSFLVTYAQADRATHARLLGLDAAMRTAFEFELTTVGCQSSWNAIPIAFGDLSLR